jgi:tRNA N6-adenosine threonylcarbamoyltransferase
VLLGLSEKGGPQHTTSLLEEVEHAAEAAGGWGAVGRIAVGTGPGSFTGLRVGIATARALGLSRGLPVSGVGTLDALGRGLDEVAGPVARLALLDARRRSTRLPASGFGGRCSALPRSSPSESPSCRKPRCAPDRARYDFASSWRVGVSRSRTTPTPCTESPRDTSALSRRPGRARTNPIPSPRST